MIPNPSHTRDRDGEIAWARRMLVSNDWIILDTETTGLSIHDEAVQLAIISPQGETLLDTLIKPTVSISVRAKEVHGISEDLLQDAPTMRDLYETILDCLAGKVIVSYNAAFDQAILAQSFRACGLLPDTANAWDCAMRRYAAFVGAWNDYHGNYRWQRLPGGDHSALGDARATLDVIRRMAAARQSDETEAHP